MQQFFALITPVSMSEPGVPTHPIAPPMPGVPTHPWVPPSPGVPTHPWVPPSPGAPSHPIVLPPEGQPGSPSHPIAPVPPDASGNYPSTGLTVIYVYVPNRGIVGPITLPPGVDAPPPEPGEPTPRGRSGR